MNNQIAEFYWNANKDNCIAILNYELKGSANAEDNSWHNNAQPSASVIITDTSDAYEVFFPSCPFDRDMASHDKYHVFSIIDEEEEHVASYDSFGEVITFFQSVI
jgi:hypothetical protein